MSTATVAPTNRHTADRNAEATVHVAHLHEKVTDALLWELMLQAGPVHHVYIPRNRITGTHFGYGFCEFHTPLDALYATKVLNSVALFSKPIRISQSTVDRVSQDVGANLFIGNLVEEVDEKIIHDAFSTFGPLIDAPYIMNPTTTSTSATTNINKKRQQQQQQQHPRRYGFVKYGRFEHADAAIAAMNGQFICNHPISVQYAFKKDSAKERHGSEAERLLAARALHVAQTNSIADKLRPNTMFADAPAPKRARTNLNNSSNNQNINSVQPQQQPIQQPNPNMPYHHHPTPVPIPVSYPNHQQQQQQHQQPFMYHSPRQWSNPNNMPPNQPQMHPRYQRPHQQQQRHHHYNPPHPHPNPNYNHIPQQYPHNSHSWPQNTYNQNRRYNNNTGSRPPNQNRYPPRNPNPTPNLNPTPLADDQAPPHPPP